MAKKKSARKTKKTTTKSKRARGAAKKKTVKRKATARKTTKRKAVAKKTVKRKATAKKAVKRKATAKKVKKAVRKAVKKKTKTTKQAPAMKKATAVAADVPIMKIAQPKQPRRTTQAALPVTPPTPRAAEEAPLSKPLITPPPTATPPPVMLAQGGPNVGDWAPSFELPDQDGRTHTLWQYRGRKIVLYFYPKDDTPGCTTEACGFRDNMPKFTDVDAVVLGMSPDDVASHKRFTEKFGLNFPLLADENHAVAERYGVWVEKQQAGKTYMGIARTTFVIDADGRIAHVFRNVSPAGHEQEVLRHV